MADAKGRYICKVQTVLGDNKCQELWYLLQQVRGADKMTVHDTIRYRREAERNVGTDEKLYRFDWVRGRGGRGARAAIIRTSANRDHGRRAGRGVANAERAADGGGGRERARGRECAGAVAGVRRIIRDELPDRKGAVWERAGAAEEVCVGQIKDVGARARLIFGTLIIGTRTRRARTGRGGRCGGWGCRCSGGRTS